MQGLGPVVQGRFVPGEELGSLHPLQNWCWYKFFTSAPVCNCHVPAVVWLISPWQCDGQSEKQISWIQSFPDLWLRVKVGSCSEEILFTSGNRPVCRGGELRAAPAGFVALSRRQCIIMSGWDWWSCLGMLDVRRTSQSCSGTPTPGLPAGQDGAITPELCAGSASRAPACSALPTSNRSIAQSSWRWQAAVWADSSVKLVSHFL